MDWFWRKVDVLVAAVFVAVTAIAASQGHAFMLQYEERLARETGQAQARLNEIKTGLRYKLMSDVVRSELEGAAQTRFAQLNIAYTAIAGAGVTKPIALLRHRDAELVAETERLFAPRLPRDANGIIYALLGALLGFLVYEVVKYPVAFLARPRQRKFRRRG